MASLHPDPSKQINHGKIKLAAGILAIDLIVAATIDALFRFPAELLFVALVVFLATHDLANELAMRLGRRFPEGGWFALHWLWLTPAALGIGVSVLLLIP